MGNKKKNKINNLAHFTLVFISKQKRKKSAKAMKHSRKKIKIPHLNQSSIELDGTAHKFSKIYRKFTIQPIEG